MSKPVEIVIGRTRIIIKGISPDDIPSSLEKYLTVFKKVSHKVFLPDWTAVRGSRRHNYIIIPRHVSINFLKEALPNATVTYNNYHTPYKRIPINSSVKPRDDLQRQSLDFLSQRHKGFVIPDKLLALETSGGKTAMTIKHIANKSCASMGFLHLATFTTRWKDEFIKLTDIKESEIAIISGKESILKALKTIETYKVFLCQHRTVMNLLATPEGSALFKKFVDAAQIGFQFFDEAHLELKSTMNVLLSTDCEETVFLTATPKRTEFSEQKIMRYVLPFNTALGLEAENRSGASVDAIFIKINSKPSNTDILSCTTARGFSTANYFNYVHANTLDNVIDISDRLASKLWKSSPNSIVAIVVGSIAVADAVVKMMSEIHPDKSIGRFYSSVKANVRHLELEKDIIVTTEKSFREGENSRVEMLINFVPQSGENGIEQMCGRLGRFKGLKEIYVDVTDIGFSKAASQLGLRKRFISKHIAKTISIVDETST